MNLIDEVYVFLHDVLEENETIEVNYSLKKKGITSYLDHVFIDYYLPNGCERLNYPPKTAIEVKNKLTSGTIDYVRRLSEYLYNSGEIFQFVLISRDISRSAIPLKKVNDDNKFLLVDFDSLKKTVEHFGRVLFKDDRVWQVKRDLLIKNAHDRYFYGKNTFFLGAGVSKDANFPGWEELLNIIGKNLIAQKKISLNESNAYMSDDNGSSLIRARYLKTYVGRSKSRFVQAIRKALYSKEPEPSKLLGVIANAIKDGKVLETITYNYDELLENYLDELEYPYSTVDCQNRPSPAGFPILHVHGFVPKLSSDKLYDENVVLSEDDYHTLYRDAFHWANIEQMHALLQTTCYFIGLSLKDPSLRRLMDIAHMHGTHDAEHFAFLKRGEFQEPRKAEDIFLSMGTNIIWYEDYKELPDLIHRIVFK